MSQGNKEDRLMVSKRIVVISDLHCGHEVGLTPPRWQYGVRQVTNDKTKLKKYEKVREQCWNFFLEKIKMLQPIDILVVNGDCIDGRGDKSGGTEEIEISRDRQCSIAIECIQSVKANKIIMTYGTPYHVGSEEDWENIIADRLGVSIGSHEWLDVNGLIIDFKHHVGSSGVVTGRYNSIAKDQLWNDMWAIRKEQPHAAIVVRSHTHGFSYIGSKNRLGIITPALQGMGSKFGARRCSGTVDFGFIHFDVDEHGGYTWDYHIAELASQVAKPIKV